MIRKSFISKSNCPFENLAIENNLLLNLEQGEVALLVYKNRPSIVMGRFQNPWIECDLGEVIKRKIHLVRRQSGGGTVYHDLNNINFCFLHKDKYHNKEFNNEVLLSFLKSLGIEAKLSGRSDILVEHEGSDYKVSGSAFKQKKDCSFHHGTFLVDSDLSVLNHLLRPQERKIDSKSTLSNRSSVINLKELKPNLSADSLMQSLCEFFSKETPVILDQVHDQDYLAQIKNENWVFGQTPKFFHTVGPLVFEVVKGLVKTVKAEDSELHPSMQNELAQSLEGSEYKVEKLTERVVPLIEQYPVYKDELEQILQLFPKEVGAL